MNASCEVLLNDKSTHVLSSLLERGAQIPVVAQVGQHQPCSGHGRAVGRQP